jgi:predicted helicase
MFPQNSARVAAAEEGAAARDHGQSAVFHWTKVCQRQCSEPKYPKLDARIERHTQRNQRAGLNKSLYDAYIKAFRWASDRLDRHEHGGIICFVSNGGWIDGNSQDGFRKCLEREFSSIYVFNLRGNQRTSGELSRKEGGKIFGAGSRTPIAVTLLVKNPDKPSDGATIHYHDIGDYLSQKEKLAIVKKFGSVVSPGMKWRMLQPNEHGDWLNQRNDVFDTFIPLAPENKFDATSESVFTTYAIGVSTNRDAWVYNFSEREVESNMRRLIAFYNEQRQAFAEARKVDSRLRVEDFIDSNAAKISWTRSLRKGVENSIEYAYKHQELRKSVYRPFCKSVLYFDKAFIESPGLNSSLFPNENLRNITICVSPSANDNLSLLIADSLANLHFNGDTQCFPLYYYEERDVQSPSLFDSVGGMEYVRRDGSERFHPDACAEAIRQKRHERRHFLLCVRGSCTVRGIGRLSPMI